MPSLTEISYLAGLIEGDGTIFIVKLPGLKETHNTIYRGDISIKMTDKEIIDWVSNLWGSNVYENKTYRNNGYKPQYLTHMNRLWGLKNLDEIYLHMKSTEQKLKLKLVKSLWMTVDTNRGRDGIPQEILSERESLYKTYRHIQDGD